LFQVELRPFVEVRILLVELEVWRLFLLLFLKLLEATFGASTFGSGWWRRRGLVIAEILLLLLRGCGWSWVLWKRDETRAAGVETTLIKRDVGQRLLQIEVLLLKLK
jgi:hypothetical protein